VGAVAAALLLTSCSGSPTPDEAIGALRTVAGGTAITVPALWAAKTPDGTYDGGIEPAEVIVSDDSDGAGYVVDLASIEAQGAGPSWEAATASAAAFATLFSGADPARVSLTFTITGPIDGPSAGGLLTCGLLAAFSGIPFQPSVTMTGTITPDGSIGIVGYIPRKVQAAAEAGYRTVVIPAEAVRDPLVLDDGRTLDELAESLGVTLVPVRNVGEAFAALTGRSSFYPAAPMPELGPGVSSTAASVAAAAVDRLGDRLANAPAGVDPAILSLSESAYQSATDALAAGRAELAYGYAAFASERLVRAAADARMRALIDSEGIESARAVVVQAADDLAARAIEQASRLAAVEPPGLEWQSSAPTMLSWPAFGLVVGRSARAGAPSVQDPETLVALARILAEERLALTEALPDAETILTSSAESPARPSAIGTLDAYSALYEEATRANHQYARDVLGQERLDAGFADPGLAGVTIDLDNIAAELRTSSASRFGEAATRTAVGMTGFWLSAAAVASAQAYGTEQPVVTDARRAFASDAQDASVDAATGTVASLASPLGARGIEPALPIWSARWSSEVATAYRGTPWSAEANWLAQGDLWFDVMQLLMLQVMARE